MKNLRLALLLTVNTISMASCFALIWQEQKESCVKRWADSGMSARWKDGAGCLVEHKPGFWVQEKFITEIRK